jgi:hypothetical protein
VSFRKSARTIAAYSAWALFAAGCEAPADRGAAIPSYDPFTGRLMQLSADQNHDGAIDQWTYLEGNRPLRGEGDTDGDGRVDRWEYFDAKAQLTRVGTSSHNDGVEDTWTWVTPIDGEARIDRSRLRDRHVDRVEFYKGETLVRVEEDTNMDGRPDKWERYDSNRLIEAAFDTTLSRGRADRRLTYDPQGQGVSVEIDPDGTGTFVRAPRETGAPKGGLRP